MIVASAVRPRSRGAAAALRVSLSGPEHKDRAPSTATPLWNNARDWTEGTTLGSGRKRPVKWAGERKSAEKRGNVLKK